jgi:hypothetical protein
MPGTSVTPPRRRGRCAGGGLDSAAIDVCRDEGRCAQPAAADDEQRAGPGRRCPALLLVPVAAPPPPGSGLAGSGLARVARQRHPKHRAARRRDGRRRLGGPEDPRRDRRAVAARDDGQADVRTNASSLR